MLDIHNGYQHIQIHTKWITMGYPLLSVLDNHRRIHTYPFLITKWISSWISTWLSIWLSIRIAMDMRSDILPDSQPGYPAGFQLCQADPTSAADSSGLPPWSERKGGVASVCLYPFHHRRDSCSGPTMPRGAAKTLRADGVDTCESCLQYSSSCLNLLASYMKWKEKSVSFETALNCK